MRGGSLAFPAYPAIIAVAVVLHLYVESSLAVPIGSVVRSFVLAPLAIAAAVGVVAIVSGWQRAALMVTVAGLVLMTDRAPLATVLIAIAAPVLIILLDLRARRRGGVWNWPKITVRANVIASIGLLLGLMHWVFAGGPGQLARDIAPWDPPVPVQGERPPDIFILMLDAYPRADTLLDYYGFDNSPFISALQGIGFDHYVESRTSYESTRLVLPAMFNMSDLDGLPEVAPVLASPSDLQQPELRNALNAPTAVQLARQYGYRVITIANGWEETLLQGVEHIVPEPTGLTQFEHSALVHSTYSYILQALMPTFFAEERRAHIEGVFNAFAEEVSRHSAAPRLVFAHVPAPHYPLVYDVNGDVREVPVAELHWWAYADAEDFRRTYVANVERLNDRALGAVRAAAARSMDTVIVLMSDTGSKTGIPPASESFENMLIARTPGRSALLGTTPDTTGLLSTLFDAYATPDRSH